MDWIERLLHVSPDGGSGTLELLYYAVLAFGAGVFLRRRVLRRRDRPSRSTPPDGR